MKIKTNGKSLKNCEKVIIGIDYFCNKNEILLNITINSWEMNAKHRVLNDMVSKISK